MSQAHLFISGFVQGVGYRQFVKREATKRGITGWVRNVPNNRVEAVLQGAKENIEEVINLCKKGPFLAEVKDVKVSWGKPQEAFSSFEIIL